MSAADELTMPPHFNEKQKAAWKDLLATADVELQVKRNRFTFEIAATLLTRFRDGEEMTATESKELKKSMVVLGLAPKDNDERGGPRKRRSAAARYFDD